MLLLLRCCESRARSWCVCCLPWDTTLVDKYLHEQCFSNKCILSYISNNFIRNNKRLFDNTSGVCFRSQHQQDDSNSLGCMPACDWLIIHYDTSARYAMNARSPALLFSRLLSVRTLTGIISLYCREWDRVLVQQSILSINEQTKNRKNRTTSNKNRYISTKQTTTIPDRKRK